MRLLIITQTVDTQDPALGFFVRWIQEFAQYTDQVEVICLKSGAYSFPAHVKVHSLGKECTSRTYPLLNKLRYSLRFYRLIWKYSSSYDSVFVHMNPEYVVLAGLYWNLIGKWVGLWYVHRSRPWYLRCALVFADVVFTASKESFRMRTPKLRVMGHGIDTSQFTEVRRYKGEDIRIVTVGRITQAKRIREMIDVAQSFSYPYTFAIYGIPITHADELYRQQLDARIQELPDSSVIELKGPVFHQNVAQALTEQSVFLNFSQTESMDKAVLEALVAGIPVVTTNPAFKEMLEPYGLFVPSIEPVVIDAAIQRALEIDMQPLVRYVQNNHSLTRLIPAMLELLSHE